MAAANQKCCFWASLVDYSYFPLFRQISRGVKDATCLTVSTVTSAFLRGIVRRAADVSFYSRPTQQTFGAQRASRASHTLGGLFGFTWEEQRPNKSRFCLLSATERLTSKYMQTSSAVVVPGGWTGDATSYPPDWGWLHYCPISLTGLCNNHPTPPLLLNGSHGTLPRFRITLTFEANLMEAWLGGLLQDWPWHLLPRTGSHDGYLGKLLSRGLWDM